MKARATYCLAVLALLLHCLLIAPVQAQVLKGTFAAGATHALSIHADGTLWATGSNQYGQLGDGTTTQQSSWVPVGTATNWVQAAAGEFYSLGLRTDGTLYTWGYNQFGQLGRAANAGTATPNATPTAVPGTWAQVAAGHDHVLALRADGSLWAWGLNSNGQLGSLVSSGMPQFSATPAQVAGTWAQVAAGEYHSLALKADGTLWAWGQNYYGQLGNPANSGTTYPNETPLQVAGTYTQVAGARAHTLALRADGSLWAWGSNLYGQLGAATNAGTTTPNATPTAVPGVYTRLACEGYHSLALRADGALYAWGSNSGGQLGSPANTTPNPTPTLVAGTYVQLAVGNYFSLALKADGTLWAWGQNTFGQLGSGSTTGTATPTATGTAVVTRSTAAGSYAGYAIRGDGTLWAWGTNQYGQLGTGTTTNSLRPTQVGSDHDWVQVVAGQSHAVALKANGTVWAWGRNNLNQASPGTAAAILVPTLAGGPLCKRLAAGAEYNLALTATGELYAWGGNGYGQLGLGTLSASQAMPTAVSGGYTFAAMSAGSGHSLALTASGALYGWGYNLFGQAGNNGSAGPVAPMTVPTLAAGAPVLTQVAAGGLHSLALSATGVAYGWGGNYDGQAGNSTTGTTTLPYPTPTAIGGLPLVTQVAAGQAHSLGLAAAGTIYSWGKNSAGALAQGTTSTNPAYVPLPEVVGSMAWAQLGTGSSATASLVRTASAQNFASAGDNSTGQLGDGTTTNWPRFDRMSPLTSLQPLPVLAATAGAAFALAPNPTRTQTTAVGVPAGTTLAVYDAVGRLVSTSASLTFSVAGLPAGLYLVRATAPGQAPQSARLVVE